MNAVTLRAHFDGEKIILDEPFELEPNTQLVVTIIQDQQLREEFEDWANLAMQGLERAYGENEPEYTEDMIKEVNPEYARR